MFPGLEKKGTKHMLVESLGPTEAVVKPEDLKKLDTIQTGKKSRKPREAEEMEEDEEEEEEVEEEEEAEMSSDEEEEEGSDEEAMEGSGEEEEVCTIKVLNFWKLRMKSRTGLICYRVGNRLAIF